MAVKAQDSITISHQKDIVAVFWFYLLQSSTSAAPSKPTAAQATAFINNGTLPGNWKLVEPSYTEGSTNSLYTVQLTKFSDDTGEWSEVSLSSSYEAAKIAYNKSVMALEAATPIETKTYTGLIGTANTAADASFYFAKIHPTNYTVQWKVSMRFLVTAPESYMQSVSISFGGYGNVFSSYDSYVVRNSALGMYFVNLYRATQAGIMTNHKGHAIGIGLRVSSNPTNSSYARTVKVELLEAENCTVDMLDTAVKYASMDGTGSTNYAGLTELSVATAGQNATNNSNTHYTQYGNAVKAGAFGVKRYTLLMKDTAETWVSFVNEANTVAATKTVSTGGHLLGKLIYSAGGAEYASGANTSTVYDAYPIDFRYSANITTSSLTAYKPVYLVGTLGVDGLFYLDTTTWWTQTVPTTEDGKTYVLVGDAYSGYQVWMGTENPAYQYYEGKFMKLEDVEAAKAAKSATKYITDLSDGIFVAPEGQGPNDTQTPTGWKIQDALELIKTGVSYIWAGLVNNVATVRVGKEAGGHSVIDENGMRVYGGSNGSTQLANIGYGEGASDPSQSATTVAPYYTFGIRASGSTVGNYSTVAGYNCIASGGYSFAEGRATKCYGYYSHTEGYETEVQANMIASHASGRGTIAYGDYQTVIGARNRTDGGTQLFIIGNGTDDNARSNAFSVDWHGNVKSYGGSYFIDISSKAEVAHFRMKNSQHDGGPYISATGELGIYSHTQSKWIIYMDKNGKVYIPQTIYGGTALGTGGKTAWNDTAHDGVWLSSTGEIHLTEQSASRGGTISFHFNRSASATTSLYEGTSGVLTNTGRLVTSDWSGTGRTPVSSATTDGGRISYIQATAVSLRVAGQWGTAGGSYTITDFLPPTSDVRLKKNVEDCEVEDALSVINRIRMRSFDWLHTDEHQRIGFIADELEQIDPKLSVGGGTERDGTIHYKSVDTFYLLGYLTKAVQELTAEINRLKGAAA